MRTCLAALFALGAAAVSACGGASGGPVQTGLTPSPEPTHPPAAQPAARPDVTALRLYDSASVHSVLAVSPLFWTLLSDDEMWTAGPCIFDSGSVEISLDGASMTTPGTILPTGSHRLGANFAHCLVDGLGGVVLHGTAATAYTTDDRSDLTALVSVSSLRGTGAAYQSDLYDVTADGSGTWRRMRTDITWAETYRPTAGSTLVNNSTAQVATFEDGSYSFFWDASLPDAAGALDQDFDDLRVSIIGTSYTLKGHLQIVYDRSSKRSYAGEVRITNDGALVARIYGDAGGALRTETLIPLAPY